MLHLMHIFQTFLYLRMFSLYSLLLFFLVIISGLLFTVDFHLDTLYLGEFQVLGNLTPFFRLCSVLLKDVRLIRWDFQNSRFDSTNITFKDYMIVKFGI